MLLTSSKFKGAHCGGMLRPRDARGLSPLPDTNLKMHKACSLDHPFQYVLDADLMTPPCLQLERVCNTALQSQSCVLP